MHISYLSKLALAATITLTMPSAIAVAQNGAGQDMKNAGSETKAAAKDTGHGVKKGTTKAYDKTKEGTKTGYHKTVNGTKKLGDKISGK